MISENIIINANKWIEWSLNMFVGIIIGHSISVIMTFFDEKYDVGYDDVTLIWIISDTSFKTVESWLLNCEWYDMHFNDGQYENAFIPISSILCPRLMYSKSLQLFNTYGWIYETDSGNSNDVNPV